jgi:uncharacterized delta-60 repeat protein
MRAPLVAFAALLALPPTLRAADGIEDDSFAGAGKRIYTFSSSSSQAIEALPLADGGLVVAGRVFAADGSYDFGAIHLFEDGSTDLNFGSLGRRTVDFDPVDEIWDDRLFALGADASGRLLLLGTSDRPTKSKETVSLPSAARLSAGGDLDTGFDGDGRLVVDTTPWEAPSLYFEGAAVAPDGKLVWVGYCYNCPPGGDARLLVVRRLATGAPDTAFDGDGWATLLRDGDTGNYGDRIAFDAAGRTLVLGSSSDGHSVFRITPTGALDPTFGDGNGVAVLPAPYSDYLWSAGGIQIDPDDGAIVVALAHVNEDPRVSVVIRLDDAGDVVDSFGDQGALELAVDGELRVSSLALQSDGKMVVAGRIREGEEIDSDFFAARVTTTYPSS